MSTNIKKRFMLLVGIIIFITFVCNIAGAVATSDTDQYVKKVYNTNFVSLFEEYGELKLVR